MNWYKHLKLAQNYYDISGEFWIDNTGNALEASGDGDYNHEAYVIESVQHKYSDGEDWHSFLEQITNQKYQELGLFTQEEIDDGLENSNYPSNRVLDMALDELGITQEELEIANGGGDARKYAMQKWRWKRVQNRNVETWTFTESDIQLIESGLWAAYGDRGNDEAFDKTEFNIYVYATETWYNEVPYELISIRNIREITSRQNHALDY